MSTARIAADQISVSGFYTWTFPGAPVRIHLQFGVVEALGREVRRAFELGASHGAEIGGLLLGKGDPHGRIVEIRDFEPLECEGRPDGRFVLSDSELRQLETKLAARKLMEEGELSVVGYYRSHIGQGLSLSEEDLSLAQGCFYDPANVFLLIKPSSEGTLSAGFFFRDNGNVDSGSSFLEFPFDSNQLATAEPIDEQSRADLPASMSFVITEDAISEEILASRRVKPPAYTLGKLPSALLLRAHAVFRQTHKVVRQAQTPRRLPLAFATPIIAVGAAALMISMAALTYSAYRSLAAVSPALGLKVRRHANDLLVSWNRDAPSIHYAREGVLYIRDGDLQPQELHLDIEQLRSASVLYSPTCENVQFRLEVMTPGKMQTSEIVVTLAAPKVDPPSRQAARNQ